jgi:cyclopropane fatty-acyl-phospholipid synthase-like methyltransferase
MFRKESRGPIERILVDFGKVREKGIFDRVVSVNASERLFCVTVATSKMREDAVMDAIFGVL